MSEHDDAVTDTTVHWAELLAEATERLGAGEARWIVEEVTGAEPGRLHAELDRAATERGVARFDALVARRERGEPLQYVLGHWGFRELDLMVDPRVLIPRPETEVVAGLAIDATQRVAATVERDVVVVDLGTGSGAIALSVAAECTRARVLATDRSPDALAVATANLTGIGRAATRVSLHEGDWFDALPRAVAGGIDVVVANPPYVSDADQLPRVVHDWEPVGALRAGPDGLDDLRRIVDGLPDWLRPGGTVVLESAPDQTTTVAGWLATAGFEASVHADLSGRPRAVVGWRR